MNGAALFTHLPAHVRAHKWSEWKEDTLRIAIKVIYVIAI